MNRRDFVKSIAGAVASFTLTRFGRAEGVVGGSLGEREDPIKFVFLSTPRHEGSIFMDDADGAKMRSYGDEWNDVIYDIRPEDTPWDGTWTEKTLPLIVKEWKTDEDGEDESE